MRCQPTHRCVWLVSLLGSVVGLTLSINVVGAVLKGTSTATVGSTLDVSVLSSLRCFYRSLEEVREPRGGRSMPVQAQQRGRHMLSQPSGLAHA